MINPTAVSAKSQCSAAACFDKDFFVFGYAEFFKEYRKRCQTVKKGESNFRNEYSFAI